MGDFLPDTLTILSSLVTSSLVTGFGLWIFKHWFSERLKQSIKHEYDMQLERFKSDVNSKNNLEIEKIKTSLSYNTIKFSKLNETRHEVIAETFGLIVNAKRKVYEYIKIAVPINDKNIRDRQKDAANAINEFKDFFPRKLIYLPEETAEKVKTVDKLITEVYHKFLFEIDQEGVKKTSEWYDIYTNFEKEVQEAIKMLEINFRDLMDIEVINTKERKVKI